MTDKDYRAVRAAPKLDIKEAVSNQVRWAQQSQLCQNTEHQYTATSRVTHIAIRRQARGKRFGMMVNAISRSAVGERCNVCIISICQDPHSATLQHFREKVSWPENGRIPLGRPGVVGVTVQSMYKNNINQRLLLGGVYLSQANLLDSGGNVCHPRDDNHTPARVCRHAMVAKWW